MRKLAVIGFPVSHSLSPVMHSAAIRHLGLGLEYSRVEIKNSTELCEFVKKARNEYVGFNVTVPYKNNIISYLDTVSPEAELAGSVNTVINKGGALHGESTDGYGLAMALKEEFGAGIRGGHFFFIGCGGAAQAVSSCMLSMDASSVLFVNRTAEKARAFTDKLKTIWKKSDIRYCSPDDIPAIKDFLNKKPIVLQSTSLGLKDSDPLPIDVSLIDTSLTVFEMIYRETPFLKAVRENGCKCADGRLMLLYQGARAFTLWTGVEAPVEVMKAALLGALKR